MGTIHPPADPARGMKLNETRYNRDVVHGETNINVVVRCRGRNEREVRENTPVVVSTNGVKGTTVDLAMGPRAPGDMTFSFDKVFSSAADQAMIFNEVAAPILEEVLRGFNCTIFVYGQTGTGKTYTMSGDISDRFPLPEDAGIIPRFLRLLFAKLDSVPGSSAADLTPEHSVKVSFIELYNEQLRDLLSADDSVTLRMFDGDNKKGHAATLVQGVEEFHITNASEGLQLLQAGNCKRQIAATKYNDFSSRSHTIFAVTVKQTTGAGEEVVCGKLSLVDLAGSENIQRSGARNNRAAEAGLINKSLLTLGRVINALVEKSKHIPYRESKLTRLLRDSLGGETKTCIVATLSPAESSFEETTSTLNYASRAKSIQNKPQLNQMLSKKTLLKEFIEEITRLKADLTATRQRNGIYLSQTSYDEMMAVSESRRLLAQEQGDRVQSLEHNLRSRDQELFVSATNFNSLNKENEATKSALDKATHILGQTESILNDTKRNLEEEVHVRRQYEKTEEQLARFGQDLISTLGQATTDISGLHSKLQSVSAINSANRQQWSHTQVQVSEVTTRLGDRLQEFQQEQQTLVDNIASQVQYFVEDELARLKTAEAELKEKSASFNKTHSGIISDGSRSIDDLNTMGEEGKALWEDVKEKTGSGFDDLAVAAERITSGVLAGIDSFHAQLQTSHASLRRDLRHSFDDILGELEKQREEAAGLRSQVAEAHAAVTHENTTSIDQLQSMIEEDECMRDQENQHLKQQIEELINSTAQQQDTRWQAMGKLPGHFRQLQNARDKVHDDLVRGDDLWVQRSRNVGETVAKSRDTIESAFQECSDMGNKHTNHLREITSSVHDETTGLLSDQAVNLDLGLDGLYDVVDRIRNRTVLNHALHEKSLQELASTAQLSYTNVGATFSSSSARVESLETDVAKTTTGLRDTLANLGPNQQICRPLDQLREKIASGDFEEYISTSLTPQRKKYSVSTVIPRTEDREVLLAQLRCDSKTGTEDTASSLRPGSPGASARLVFADPPTINEGAPRAQSRTTIGGGTAGNGLRELDPNSMRLPEPSSTGLLSPNRKRPRTSVASDIPVAKSRRRGITLGDGLGDGEMAMDGGEKRRVTRTGVARRLRSSRYTGV